MSAEFQTASKTGSGPAAPTTLKGIVSTVNSSDAPLGPGAVFTGAAVDVLDGGIAFVNVATDADSAIDGLDIQQSSDGANWDHCDGYTVEAGEAKNYAINLHSHWMRVIYTNGALAQTYLRLQTIVKTQNAKPSSHRVKDEVVGDDDCELVKSAITGENGDGDWHNVKVTKDGNLDVVDNASGLSIAQGKVAGAGFVHKFGNAPDFDVGDGEVNIWDGANDAGSNLMQYTYSTAADIDRLSSSNNSDTQDVEVQGLDGAGALIVQTVTLTGQTPVALTTPLRRVFRLKNVGSSDFLGRIYCFVNVATTAGVPNTLANVRAEVDNGNNQTLMAIYTIPAGKTGYMRSFFASTARASRDSNYSIRLRARPTGGVFQLKHLTAVADKASSWIQHSYHEPEIFAEGTDIEMTAEVVGVSVTQASISAGFDIVIVDN